MFRQMPFFEYCGTKYKRGNFQRDSCVRSQNAGGFIEKRRYSDRGFWREQIFGETNIQNIWCNNLFCDIIFSKYLAIISPGKARVEDLDNPVPRDSPMLIQPLRPSPPPPNVLPSKFLEQHLKISRERYFGSVCSCLCVLFLLLLRVNLVQQRRLQLKWQQWGE